MAVLEPDRGQPRRLWPIGAIQEVTRTVTSKVRVVGYRCGYCKVPLASERALLKHFEENRQERPVHPCVTCDRGNDLTKRHLSCHICAPVFDYVYAEVSASNGRN